MRKVFIILIFLIISVLIPFKPAISVADYLDNWHLRCDTAYLLYGVTYGNGTFVAVGYNGIILSSPDGITWTERTSHTTESLNGATYGEGIFVVVGDHGTILISSDGETWITRTGYSGTTNDLTSVAYGNGKFVAVGDFDLGPDYDRTVVTSPDGYTWTVRHPQPFLAYPYGIGYGNGLFVAVGLHDLYGSHYYDISTSSDGIQWTPRNYDTYDNLNGVAYGNNIFVAVGGYGALYTSPDGIDWTERNSGTSDTLNGITYGNGIFVAVGYSDTIITSSDGIAWTQRYPEIFYKSYYSIAYGQSTFVAVAYFGEIIQSDPSPPDAPSSLTAKATSSSSIFLSWKDNSVDEPGFKIERKEGVCGSISEWSQVQTVGKNAKTYTDTGLTPNITYAYRVRAYNMDINSAYSNCASSKTALSGTPNAPTTLNATSISANQIKLIWTDNSTNEASFTIYRKVGSGSWNPLSTKGENFVSHTDITATGNTITETYSYYLQACNSNGCSPATNSAIVPYKPTNLSSTAASSSRINLAWADKSSNETGFQIYRKSGVCSSPSAWGLIATKGANSISHSNIGLSSGTTYSYRVRAYKKSSTMPYAYGYSSYSNCKSATTP